MDKFITADTHFSHVNVLKHCSRPFADVQEMNSTIIKNWNAKVPENGLIYILGDFAFVDKISDIRALNNQLNGHKVLIYGNHDKICKKTESMGFQSKTFYAEEDIYDGKDFRRLIMFHYPLLSWNRQFHGSWLAYGHCHGNLISKMNAIQPGTWDVGVDTNNFTPLSFNDLAVNINTTYKVGDK